MQFTPLSTNLVQSADYVRGSQIGCNLRCRSHVMSRDLKKRSLIQSAMSNDAEGGAQRKKMIKLQLDLAQAIDIQVKMMYFEILWKYVFIKLVKQLVF